MESVKFQVLGFKNLERKSDKKKMTILVTVSQCSKDDNARGIYGMKVTEFFLPDEKVGTLTQDCIGQEFKPEYGINGFGRPQLSNYSFVAWK
ncbi:MAG: hypothetical protein K2N85_09350 [Lachnospiraceae bacterium]|nr:hypothetical protein [Lachnospiraceae bacterium]